MYTIHTRASHAHNYIHTITCTLHTCCSCKWYLLSSSICAFFSIVFCWRKTSSHSRFSASLRRQLGAHFCWESRVNQGGQANKLQNIHVKCWTILIVVCMLLMYMLKGRNIHTCSNSKLYNVGIIHRAQDNSWTTDNSWSIVLYVQQR